MRISPISYAPVSNPNRGGLKNEVSFKVACQEVKREGRIPKGKDDAESLLLELKYMKEHKIPFCDFDDKKLIGDYGHCLFLAGDIKKDDPRVPEIVELLKEYGEDDAIAMDIIENIGVPSEILVFDENKLSDRILKKLFDWSFR